MIEAYTKNLDFRDLILSNFINENIHTNIMMETFYVFIFQILTQFSFFLDKTVNAHIFDMEYGMAYEVYIDA